MAKDSGNAYNLDVPVNRSDGYRHLPPLPVEGDPHVTEDDPTIVPGVHEQIGADAWASMVSNAVEITPLELQDEIDKRADGNTVLFEWVLVNCRGRKDLADFLLEQHDLQKHLEGPAPDERNIKARLAEVNQAIKSIKEKLV